MVAVLAPGGCADLGSYRCAQSASCTFHGTAGFCESNGWCSFPDPSCAGGRRYGSYVGDGLAGSCVTEPGDALPPDAMLDAMGDAPTLTHSVSILLYEVRGMGAVTGMVAGAFISIKPLDFRDDYSDGTPPALGCVANVFSLPVDAPWVGGDVGTIFINGYSGRGSATAMFGATTTCMRSSVLADPFQGYHCDLPPLPIDETMGPANFLNAGDRIAIHATGGPASDNMAFDLQALADDTLTVGNGAALVQAATFSEQPLTINIDCGASVCGTVGAGIQTSDVTIGGGGSPVHYASVICTQAMGPGAGSMVIPGAAMRLVNNTPWHSLQTFVVRFGELRFDSTHLRLAGAGQGQFFTATR